MFERFLNMFEKILRRRGGYYRNMNPIGANRDTQTKIQMPTPGVNDHVKANQGRNEDNR